MMSDGVVKSGLVCPVDDWVVVKRNTTEVTEGGIHLPEARKQDTLKGSIVAIGPGVPLPNGERARPSVMIDDRLVVVKLGDGLIYRAEDAYEAKIGDQKYDIVRFRDAVAVLKVDPALDLEVLL